MSEELWITFADVKRLFLRLRKTIFSVSLLAFIATFAYLLINIPKFSAEATFKQGSGKLEQNSDLKNLFRSISAQDNESTTHSIMYSNTLLRRCIEDLGWQAAIPRSTRIKNAVSNIMDNLRLEIGKGIDDPDLFSFKQVKHLKEKPLSLYLLFSSKDTFEIYDSSKAPLGISHLGDCFSIEESRFTLEKTPKDLKLGRLYPLTLLPWTGVVAEARRNFSIKPSPLDKNVLKLKYSHRNRHNAAAFINQIILCYQDYLREETQAVADAQLKYLERRQDELNSKLDKTLDEHVVYLKKALGDQGFIGLDQEIELMSQPQEMFTSKLFDVEFELSRLQHGVPLMDDAALAADLSGIDSEAAKNLFLQYTNLLDSLHATIKQLNFIRTEMASPGFELSSLSNVLTDPITQEMVQKAGSFEFALHDDLNRSDKEQQRVRESLATQKKYIASHISQSIDLHKIRLEMTKNKLSSLQHIMIDILKNEKVLIEKKLSDIKEKMGDLPEKWRLENKLKLKTELTKGMMEGLTQITESKNLNRHLYHVESRVIDPAFSPLGAQPPRLFLFSFVSAVVFALGTFLFLFLKGVIRGLPISLENLSLLGESTCGKLSVDFDVPLAEISDADLETLRRVASFLLSGKKSPVAVFGKNTDFAPALAELLLMHHQRSLLITCDFDHVVMAEETPGLWHYLSGAIDHPPIRKGEKFDTLPSGGTTRHSAELLAETKFETVLQGYDFIFLLNRSPIDSTEARSVLNLAESAIIALDDEPLQMVNSYREWSRQKAKSCVTFIEIENMGIL